MSVSSSQSPIEDTVVKSSEDTASRRAQDVFRISLSIFIVMAVISAIGAIVAFITRENYFGVMVTLGVSIAAAASAFLNRRGRTTLGVMILIVSMWIGTVLFAFIADYQVIAIALLVVILTWFISVSTLTQRLMAWMVFSSFAVGVIAILLDLFGPDTGLPGMPTLTLPLVAVTVIFYGYLIARQFRNLSLTNKLIIAFLAVTILVSGVLGFFTQRSSSRSLTDRVGLELYDITDAEAYAIGDLLDRQIAMLQSLAIDDLILSEVEKANQQYIISGADIQAEIDQYDKQWRAADVADNNEDPLVKERLNNLASADLRKFNSIFPDNVETFLTDHYGALVATTNRTSDYYQADEGWWQAAFNEGLGAVYIGTPEFDVSAGKTSIIIALPIRKTKLGSPIGILRTTYVLSGLQTILSARSIGETGETDIYFPGDTILVMQNNELKPADPLVVNQLNALADKIYAEIELDGEPVLISQAPIRSTSDNPDIKDLGWFVSVHQTVEEALAPVRTQTRVILLLVIVIVGVVSGGAILIAQYMTRPIIRLTETAERVREGDLNAQATITSTDEVGKLATAFNEMTDRLRQTLEGLERRIEDRTRAIELSADVSRRLSTILDPSRLVAEVVELLQFAFNYYHVHIYLLDEQKVELVMVGGTGEPGRIMLERGHKLPQGKGLVGRASETASVVLVTDTTQDPDWLPNPLLPETKSEIAVPIMLGDTVMGVLDVQQNVVGGLGQQDADLLRGVANQVAIALRNAQQYAEAQQRAEREIQMNTIVQQIQKTQTIESALQLAVRELGHAMHTSRTAVRLHLNQDKDQ